MVYLKSRERFGECYSVFDEDTGKEEGFFFSYVRLNKKKREA